MKKILLWLGKALVEALILFILYGVMANIVDDRCSQAVSAQPEKISPERYQQFIDIGKQTGEEFLRKKETPK